ncbi:MAG: vWA domain-containing protein [Chloroflexota bacterium]
MTLLQPTALWALAAIPLIILLYILRPRHQRIVLSSVRLWQHISSDLEGRPRWRLPVATLLLLVQVLIAGAVAVTLARPSIPGAVGQHLILLVDTSPSMLATDVSPNRLALATQDARQLVSALKPEDQATLIDVGPSPSIVATGKGPHALDQALASLTVSPQPGDLQSALALAAQTADLSRDTHNRVVILSDGAFGPVSLKDAGPIPADVSFQQVGGSDENQGITALSVRPMIGSTNRYLGFVQVANFAQHDARVGVRATADGLQIYNQTLTVPARQPVEVSLTLPQGTHLFAVSIGTQDKYSLDNQAEALVPQAQVLPVTVVAADPSLWQRALKTLPTVRLTTVNPGAYKPDGAAVTIFDGFVPATLPSGNILMVAPPAGNAQFPVSGNLAASTVVQTDDTNPLFDSVDLSGLYIQQPEHLGAMPWAHPIVETTGGPIMLDGELNGRQVVVIGFDPSTTDWPQRIAFPVFVANAVQALAPRAFPAQIDPGTALDLPAVPEADSVLVQLPNGKVDVFSQVAGPIRFTDTSQVGHYVVTDLKGSTTLARNEFVASSLGITRSDIAPRVDPQGLTQTGSPAGKPTQHEVWPWVVGGVLALLSAEWLLYFRRLVI